MPRRAVRCMAATALAVGIGLGGVARADTTLRVVPQADLRILDTVYTTANITSNHGYMAYDNLFAYDADFLPQPQMVDAAERSEDGLFWTFTLRDGMTFHDGSPVEAKDAVASIRRYNQRIAAGQSMARYIDEIVATGERSFEIRFTEPFGPLLDMLATPENPLFVHREQDALTPPDQQITEAVGSGPFRFLADEWEPGNKVVYARNEDYRPRDEAPSGFAGGRVPKVDRVEWIYIPDSNTATQALIAGEVDAYEIPPVDLIPLLAADPGITVTIIDPIGTQALLRPNHLVPPFDNPKARQALLYLVGDQRDYLSAMVGDPDLQVPCWSVFVCGTPLETEAGVGDWNTGDRAANLERARALLAEAGYAGEPVVVMDPTDSILAHAQALVTAQKLREAGMNVDLQAMDWSTMISRRPVKDAPADNPAAWNIFHTWGGGAAMGNPLTNPPAATPCDQSGWFGWPCDDELERLRAAYVAADSLGERQRVIGEWQARAYEVVPYIPVGQFLLPTAYRNSLSGVLETVRLVLWNIEKEG